MQNVRVAGRIWFLLFICLATIYEQLSSEVHVISTGPFWIWEGETRKQKWDKLVLLWFWRMSVTDLEWGWTYEGCSKWIAYFYLETSNFKLAQTCSFHALEVLPVARNAKFQPMYPILEGVMVRWFGHSNKVLMNGRSKCLSGLVFPPSKECFQFRKQKEITWGNKVGGGGGGGGAKQLPFSFFKNAITIAEVWAGALSCRRQNV